MGEDFSVVVAHRHHIALRRLGLAVHGAAEYPGVTELNGALAAFLKDEGWIHGPNIEVLRAPQQPCFQ